MNKTLVGIIMGSDSDLEIMKEAAKILEELSINYQLNILSAHRTPDELNFYVKEFQNKLSVLIAAAGGAAHLAGSIAALTIIPVIGVPIDSTSLKGIDSLYSTVQMPSGIPVASMSIGVSGAKNAALYAAQILALQYSEIQKKINQYKIKMKNSILNKNDKLNKLGWKNYLKQ